jgi:pilus assembly protein CpaE
MNHIVIAEPDEQLAERLKTAVLGASGQPVPVTSLDDALDSVEVLDPQVLVIGPTLLSDIAFDLTEHLSAAGRTSVVLTSGQFDASLLRRALRAGVTDVVAIAEPISDISSAITHAIASAERIRAQSTAALAPEQQLGKMITVFSTKGGVGKTVLSINLAVALARETGARVALVDLDLEFGDVGIMLGLKPTHTVFDVVQAFDRLDAEMLSGFMEPHSSGVSVLLAPVRPEDADGISAARMTQILDLVRANFDYVVVDTCPAFTEPVLAALDRSDDVYLLTMMDVASVKNTRIALQKLRQLGYDNGRIQLVLNRSDSKVLLEVSEVEEAIGGKIVARIPSDRLVPRCVNKGVPIVVEMPRSDVAKSIVTLAKQAAIVVEKGAEDVA